MQKFKYLSKNKAGTLPKTAGVYAFKNSREFLYIGKAVNIQSRVKNHFQQPIFKDSAFIIPKTDKIGYIKTNSEIEALLLEAELIKKYKPKYNVIWKDDKNFTYIVITKETFPRVFATHQPGSIWDDRPKLNQKIVGPFVDAKAIRQTLKILRKVFPYRTCRTLPKKKCLFYNLNLCPAPCEKHENKSGSNYDDRHNLNQKEYEENIKNLIKILQGKKQSVAIALKKEMKIMSKKQEFEKAAVLRNKIFALESVFQNAHIIKSLPAKKINWAETEKKLRALTDVRQTIIRIEGYDISNIQGLEATGSMVVFENGIPNKKEYKKFKIKITEKPNDTAMLKEVLERRLSHTEWPLPQVMLIDGGKAQLNTAIKAVSNKNDRFHLKQNKIKIISLAKRNNELFIEAKEKPLLLKGLHSGISNLILQIRDESHRFAISYHKKLRSKNFLKN